MPAPAKAADRIPTAFEQFYREKYPAVYAGRRPEILASAQHLAGIYEWNVFPEMNVKWGDYPNNLGHMDFPGCFRCHDGGHNSADGKIISADCNACHNLLAADERSPKILSDLGIVEKTPPPMVIPSPAAAAGGKRLPR